MLVAVQKKVDALLHEQLLQPVLEAAVLLLHALAYGGGRRVAVAVAGAVDGAVAVHNEPRDVLAVGVGLFEVGGHPVELRLDVDAGGLDAEVDLGAHCHVVHEAVVPRIVPAEAASAPGAQGAQGAPGAAGTYQLFGAGGLPAPVAEVVIVGGIEFDGISL